MAERLCRDRFRPEVVCLYFAGALSERLRELDVPLRVVGLDRDVRPGSWVRVLRELGGRRPDIVHTHLPEAAWFGLPAAFCRRVPVRIRHLHGASGHWPRRVRRLDRAAAGFASLSLACSAAVADFAVGELGYRAQKLRVLHNGIDISRFDDPPDKAAARRSLGLPEDAPVLLCVAALSWRKGQADLLEAMARLRSARPDALLLLAGAGGDAMLRELHGVSGRLGLGDSVRFLGPRDDVPSLMAASDLFVLPSLTEGLPLVLAEAGAAGLPAVATRVGGVPEVVEHGVGGLLVPPRDPRRMADALAELLGKPERMRSMGAAARRHVARRFTVEEMVATLERIYLELLHSRVGARRAGSALP